MKTIFYSAIIVAFTFFACNIGGKRIDGNGNITTETRHIENLSKIELLGGIDVFIEKGEASVKVEADENLLPYIVTENRGGWLEIKQQDNVRLNSTKPIRVYITTPDLSDVKVTGSGNLTSNAKFNSADKVSFSVTGSGNIQADVNAPAIEAEIRGSGNVQLTGETKDVNIEIAGSGNYLGFDLKAEDARVTIAGSGDANVFADRHLKVNVAGSGDVKFRGNPEVDKDIAGSGSVGKE